MKNLLFYLKYVMISFCILFALMVIVHHFPKEPKRNSTPQKVLYLDTFCIMGIQYFEDFRGYPSSPVYENDGSLMHCTGSTRQQLKIVDQP